MIHEIVIAQLFQLVNFVLLIIIGIYFWYTRAKPVISQKIEEQSQADTKLTAQKIALKKKSAELQNQIIDQEKLCAHLLAMVQKWRDVHAAQQAMANTHMAHRAEKIQEKINRQQKELETMHLYNKSIRQALDIAHRQLQSHVANTDYARTYMDSILRHMTKGDS